MDKEDIKWLIDTVLTIIQIVLTVILADKATVKLKKPRPKRRHRKSRRKR